MWYFSWVLGLGLAISFGVLNAIWYEVIAEQRGEGGGIKQPAAANDDPAAP
jgi:cyd operon protein YbgT